MLIQIWPTNCKSLLGGLHYVALTLGVFKSYIGGLVDRLQNRVLAKTSCAWFSSWQPRNSHLGGLQYVAYKLSASKILLWRPQECGFHLAPSSKILPWRLRVHHFHLSSHHNLLPWDISSVCDFFTCQPPNSYLSGLQNLVRKHEVGSPALLLLGRVR
jgi:hypothetical protein